MNDIVFSGNYPAKLARELMDHKIDLGLVPVAIIPELNEYYINTGYCIGCDGPVASVCIFSDVPIEEADNILMDYQSRTSVALARVLLKEYWKLDTPIINTTNDYRAQIKGRTAGLVIGDRALEQRKHATYIYDLGEVWKQHTGLPFVFAAWVSLHKLSDEFVYAFNDANASGLEHIADVVKQTNFAAFDLHDYFTKHISYTLDEGKLEGLQLFLSKLKPIVAF